MIAISSKLQMGTLGALLVLTAISYGVSFLDLGGFDMSVAIGIAAVKAAFVILVFMHLLEGKTSMVLALFSALFFVALLVTFVGVDTAARDLPPLRPPTEGVIPPRDLRP